MGDLGGFRGSRYFGIWGVKDQRDCGFWDWARDVVRRSRGLGVLWGCVIEGLMDFGIRVMWDWWIVGLGIKGMGDLGIRVLGNCWMGGF